MPEQRVGWAPVGIRVLSVVVKECLTESQISSAHLRPFSGNEALLLLH